jgi:hypothetical protein
VDVVAANGKGAWLIAGIAIGFALIGHVRWLTPALPRSDSLARNLAPLALPLLTVAMIGTVEQAKWLQLLAGSLGIVVGWGCFVAPDAKRTAATLTWEHERVRELARLGFKLFAIAALVGFALWLWLRDSVYIRDRGGLAGVAFLMAMFMWVVVAGVLRLVAYARSWARAVVSAMLVGTLVALLIYAGIVPGDRSPASPVAMLAFTGAALLAWIAAWFVDAGRSPLGGPLGEKRADVAASVGLGAALLASGALAFAAVLGLIRTADPGDDRQRPTLAQVVPTSVRPYPAIFSADDRNLAKNYFPVLALTVHERWAPMATEYYLPDVTMTGPGDDIRGPTLDQLPATCPTGTGEACYTLSLPDCHDGEPSCAPDTDFDRTAGRAMYVRIERLRHELSLPRPFGSRGRRLATIVQYWMFYRYDRWSQRALTGRLTQQHQGDWENVTLGFDPGDHPLFVAYSAHCAGTVRPWGKVRTIAIEKHKHPLVGVAEGSQANYPKVNQAHTPDWLGCQGRPKGLLSLIGYASNIRDLTEYGRLWYPTELIPARADKPPMSFPGTWGEDDRTELMVARPRTLDMRRGPKSPPLQPSWRDPVGTIFCGDYAGAKCMRR